MEPAGVTRTNTNLAFLTSVGSHAQISPKLGFTLSYSEAHGKLVLDIPEIFKGLIWEVRVYTEIYKMHVEYHISSGKPPEIVFVGRAAVEFELQRFQLYCKWRSLVDPATHYIFYL